MTKVTSTTISKVYLTQPQLLLVYRLWAEFRSPSRTVQEFSVETGISLSTAVVSDMCRNPEAMVYINKFREEFLMKVKEVPIANKRVRLDALQKTLDENSSIRETLDTASSDGRKELSMVQRRNNETLCVAREEMEGKPLIMQQFNFSSYSGLTDEELQKRKEEIISKNQRVKTEVVDV